MIAGPAIDCHAHVYLKNLPFAPTAWHKPDQDASIGQYLSLLRAHGLTHAVLAGASVLGDYNDYAIAATRTHLHLRTTVVVAPEIDPYVLSAMDADGVVGIRLQCMHRELPELRNWSYQKLFRRAADLGWHVHLHDDGSRLPGLIPPILESGVRLVIDHFGRPSPQTGREGEGYQAVLRAVETGRCWVKLSAGFRLASPGFAKEMARALIADVGGERLVWGTDWPFANFETEMKYEQAVRTFSDWVPDERTRLLIGHDTPRALYFDR